MGGLKNLDMERYINIPIPIPPLDVQQTVIGGFEAVDIETNKHVETINEYCRWNDDAGRAAGTIRNKKYAVSWFLDEVAKQKCVSLNNLSPELIVRACTKVTDRSHWGEIGRFLRYLAVVRQINCGRNRRIKFGEDCIRQRA